MASEQEYTRQVPVEQTTEPAHAGGRKPSMMEQVKEKVADVKDKLTGGHHASSPTKHAESETQAPKPQSPKGEGFLQKIKDKLPGTHAHQQKTATATPDHTATETTEPATHTGEPVHKEGIAEKVRHVFTGGHSDAKTGEHTREVPEGVTESDVLKE